MSYMESTIEANMVIGMNRKLKENETIYFILSSFTKHEEQK
jgi:hypothetical protein